MSSEANLTYPISTFKMLPSFKAEMEQAQETYNKTVKPIMHDRKVSTVVLTVLATIVAAGGGVLLYFSGGVGNLPLFCSGVGLGALSLGLAVWVVVIVKRAANQIDEANATHVKIAQGKITLEEIYEAMLASGKEENIQAAVQKIKDNNDFPQFVKLAFANECSDQTVLKAIASCTEDLQAIVPNLPTEFAVKMLETLDPDSAPSLLQALFDRIGGPNKANAPYFARHLQAFVQAVKLDKVNPQAQIDVIQAMDEAQKLEYLQQHVGDVETFLRAVVTADYMKKVDVQSDLFKAIVLHWEVILKLKPAFSFLQAIYETMDNQTQKVFIDKIASVLASKAPFKVDLHTLPPVIFRSFGVYLERNPQMFFDREIDEFDRENKKACKSILDLLECHSNLCEHVLSNLDKSMIKRGKVKFILRYPRYTALLKVLIQEANGDERQSLSRIQLMAKFREAKEFKLVQKLDWKKELDKNALVKFFDKTDRHVK